MLPNEWHKKSRILIICVVIIYGAMLIFDDIERIIPLGVIFLLLAVLFAGNVKYWRCPDCDRHLPGRTYFRVMVEYCPYCGKALDQRPGA